MPIRTPAEQPIRLHNWKLRFYDAKNMDPSKEDVAEDHLRKILDLASQSPLNKSKIESIRTKKNGDVICGTPWFRMYMKEFLRTMNFSPHEAMDIPIICKCFIDFAGLSLWADSLF